MYVPSDNIEFWKRKIRKIYFYMCGSAKIKSACEVKGNLYERYTEHCSNPLLSQERYENYKFLYEFFDKYMIK